MVQKRNSTTIVCDLTPQTEFVLAKITKREVLKEGQKWMVW